MKTWMSFQSDANNDASIDAKRDGTTLGRETHPPRWQGTPVREQAFRLESRGKIAWSHRERPAGLG